MLIKITDYYKAKMYLNPDHIVFAEQARVADDCVIVHMTQKSIVLTVPEWERIEPLVAMPPTVLEERYHTALHTIYRQAGMIEALQARINPPAADDDQDDQQAFIDANEPL